MAVSLALYILAGGLLTRADGWGPESEAVAASWPSWKHRLVKFFSVWTCGALFGIASLLLSGDILASFVAAVAFLVWRIPGFNGWEKWGGMWVRGAWPSLIGFTALSFAVHGQPFYGWLFAPFACVYALCYSGSYKWIKYPQCHIVAEITSGMTFAAFIAVILQFAL